MSEEKKLTKYDLKMQKRAEEKAKSAKEDKLFTVVGIVVVIAIIALIASFPIRSYRSLHKTLFSVNGRAVQQVEFDYYYNIVKNSYISGYGDSLAYYGVDMSTDLSTVPYSDTMTFQDYFEELTVNQIKENYAILDTAKAEGFTYDASEDYKTFLSQVKTAAKEDGSTEKDYVKKLYGGYATTSRLESVVKDAATVSAFYRKAYDEKLPADAEIQAYYEENANTYDKVNYYLNLVNAQMPTAPTELADEGAAVAEDGSYTPSDAEKEAAMAEAKAEADSKAATVMNDGIYNAGARSTDVNYYIRNWLFDAERTNGDTTVIEDSYNNTYYVVGFAERYLDETPTVDARVIVTQEDNGAAIVAEYEASAKTEEAFEELVTKYTIDTDSIATGGLYENQTTAEMTEEMQNWFNDPARAKGDVTSFFLNETYTYTVYYMGTNDPEWKLEVTDTMMNSIMDEYVTGLASTYEVSDPKGNLAYIAIRAKEEADAAAAAAETSTDASAQ